MARREAHWLQACAVAAILMSLVDASMLPGEQHRRLQAEAPDDAPLPGLEDDDPANLPMFSLVSVLRQHTNFPIARGTLQKAFRPCVIRLTMARQGA